MELSESMPCLKPSIQAWFEPVTGALSYIAWDAESGDAVIVDPILDYDPIASRIGTGALSELTDFIHVHRLRPRYVLETHAHADHLSGSRELQQRLPAAAPPTAIGAGIVQVQKAFQAVFNFGEEFATDGRQFDLLLDDEQGLHAGSLNIRTLSVPGHTPACMAYLIGDALFTGDSLFMPDYGVGRCDFPGGSAAMLYDSIQGKLYSLPDHTRVFVGHDYRPGGRELRYESTIGEEKAANVQLNRRTRKQDFIDFRERRDQSLPAPRLMYQSVQFNLNGGQPPAPESNGTSYFKIPLRR